MRQGTLFGALGMLLCTSLSMAQSGIGGGGGGNSSYSPRGIYDRYGYPASNDYYRYGHMAPPGYFHGPGVGFQQFPQHFQVPSPSAPQMAGIICLTDLPPDARVFFGNAEIRQEQGAQIRYFGVPDPAARMVWILLERDGVRVWRRLSIPVAVGYTVTHSFNQFSGMKR